MVSLTLVGLSSSTSVFTWGSLLEMVTGTSRRGPDEPEPVVRAPAQVTHRSMLLRAKSRAVGTTGARSPGTGDDHGNSAAARWSLQGHPGQPRAPGCSALARPFRW